MIEPEAAWFQIDDIQRLAEDLIVFVVERVLDRKRKELTVLERDLAKLEAIKKPFPRITYRDALEILTAKGCKVSFGDDFGGDEETIIAQNFERPVIITRYPAQIKAFYMASDPQDPELALGMDVLAPEGYGRSWAEGNVNGAMTSFWKRLKRKTCQKLRSNGTWIYAGSDRCPMPGLGWVWNGRCPGFAACTISGRPSHFPGPWNGYIPDPDFVQRLENPSNFPIARLYFRKSL